MAKEVVIPEGTPEERDMYLKLIKKFGLKVAKTIEPIPGAVKVIKGETYCSLCEATTYTFVKMIKYTDGVWKSEGEITEKEAEKIDRTDSHKENVSCCSGCVDYLMNKDKMELVKMIMRSKSPTLLNKAVKRALKEMREDNKNE